MENENEWLSGLADKVALRIKELENGFRDMFIVAHLGKHPTDSDEIAWHATNRALGKERSRFFVQAMSEVITADVVKQGDAVYFSVVRILSSRSAAKRRGRRWVSKKNSPHIQLQTIQPTAPSNPFELLLDEVDAGCATRNNLAYELGRRGKRRGRVY